jgi:hypothetical protein
MEGFSGILICCTNLSVARPAALSRFALKVGFKPLSEEGPPHALKRFCQRLSSPSRRERLARLDFLTPETSGGSDEDAILSSVMKGLVIAQEGAASIRSDHSIVSGIIFRNLGRNNPYPCSQGFAGGCASLNDHG